MDTITAIPLEQLHASPFNPRRTFDDATLAELATDIKAQGRVLQPLLVRPRIFAQGLARRTDGLRDDDDTQDGYEIVFGHRRYRAAEMAGLATVPCMVRALTDDEARRAQISENLQRVDVHPIEEAEGFQALLDSTQHTADDLAAQFGKSRSYVYGRLKLLQACPEIRKACLAGEIGSEVALLVARLRTPKLQEKALGYIRADWRAKLDDGGKASYRHIRDLLNEKFTLALKDAIFDIEDEMLVPLAGHCLRCPKRAGNAPEFDDVTHGEALSRHARGHHGADVCTDPDCFAAKKTAHLKREADKLAATGKTVIAGNAARSAISAHGEVKGAYIAIKDATAAIKSIKGGAATVPTVTIQDPRTGKTFKAVKRDDLQAAGVKVKADKPKQANDWEQQRRAAEEERAKRQAKADALTAANIAILDKTLAAMAGQPRTTQELYWMALRVWEGSDYETCEQLAKRHGMKNGDALEKALAQLPADRLALIAIECVLLEDAIVDEYDRGKSKGQRLLASAAHYGVDLGAGVKVTSTPAAAAQAPKGAPAGAKRKPGPKPKSRPTEQTDDAGVAGGRGAQVDAFEEVGA